ncbi:ParB/RepB/Spo0J family partition protein [Patescibacteria group bacterium]|nr:ParB/RepB/Spo0J family partition protein [Patescibacteria group bacterium]MCL5409528.1 ParB/RepB/Spo0J family partition protein [Patescibacteria group bacterium]
MLEHPFLREILTGSYVPNREEHMDINNRLREIEKYWFIRSKYDQQLGDSESLLEDRIKNHCSVLGLRDPYDTEGFVTLDYKLYRFRQDPPKPEDYPTEIDFAMRHKALTSSPEGKFRFFQWFVAQRSVLSLPAVPEYPLASEVAEYAQADFNTLQKRYGSSVESYLYKLGIIMSYEYPYTVSTVNYPIRVNSRWEVLDGRHRIAVLRILGNEYIDKHGLNYWLVVNRVD